MRRFEAAGALTILEQWPLDGAGQERRHARRERHAALGLFRLFADDDIPATAFLQLAVNLKRFAQPHSGAH